MGKLFLIALMKEVGFDKFNDMVAEARNQLMAEARWTKRGYLENLFHKNMGILEGLDTLEQIMNFLWQKKGSVLQKALAIWEEKYHNETLEQLASRGIYIFIPVIPRTYLSIYTQMLMVKSSGNMGYTNLVPTAITDTNITDMPEDPYYIYDVEDGELMRGKTAQDAEDFIEEQGRLGLTEVEVIALGIHTNVLSRHNVDAVGSRYDYGVPHLQLYEGLPKLDEGSRCVSHALWGAASCGSRG